MKHSSEKIIRFILPAIIVIPIAVCIILASRIAILENRIAGREAYEELGSRESRLVQLSWYDENVLEEVEVPAFLSEYETADAAETDEPVYTGQNIINTAPGLTYASGTETDGIHRVYLTFDDGPSIYTDDILDILDEYGVKATFFVVGRENTASYSRYIRIVEEGHTLGMHSYSHVYSDIYASPESFAADTQRIRSLLEDVTGQTPVFYRFPGGSSNDVSATDVRELAEYLESQGIIYFDWNVSSGDAGKVPLTSDQIVRNALNGIETRDTTVILLHDTAAKRSTVAALPAILEALQAMDNVEILPITYDTAVIQHDIGR
ncbi:MAG: polysaccharide deacetylase [Lachnospiraceae bacterium]|nr:polysaccharide deacetylase [Lachnospiraceae bacterium]